MLKRELTERAGELGFARLRVCALPDFRDWRESVEAMPDPRFERLTDDIRRVMEGDCRAVLLFMPYRPFVVPAGEVSLSAYYPVSDRSHSAALKLAEWLEERGWRAVGSPGIPYKPVAAAAGCAAYGRNGLTAAEGFGSRYALQIVLTDAPLEADPPTERAERLSRLCERCGACVRACPTGALDGTGRVDIRRCLRAKSEEYPIAEEFRPLVKNSLFGCDVCQDVCPRNADIEGMPMPEPLREALDLAAMLEGKGALLAPFIGKNYARKARIQAKACLIAANLGRKDLLPLIGACADSPVDFVREHARWAMERLRAI